MEKQNTYIGYIGTYTKGESKGIYQFALDTVNETISTPELAAELTDPTYLAISGDQKHLYSVLKDSGKGGVASFLIEEKSGELKLMNKQLTENGSSCHISVDENKQWIVTANYGDGIVESYSVNKDGSVGNVISAIQHEGAGPYLERQERAHAHFAGYTPAGSLIATVDLGTDEIITYKIEEGKLTEASRLHVTPGSGPRHLVFHPNGKYAYVKNEISPEVIVLEFNAEKGSFREIQTVFSIPSNYSRNNQGSAIHISSDGNFVYAADRGHDSISVFKTNPENGTLELVETVSTAGHWPRDFSLDPTEKFLIASNEESGNLSLFRRDVKTGKLTLLQSDVKVPYPVCVKFLK
ncbi:lactonase family protein [Bacillus massiliglaciei]|uniref:lactonase family protein n=1 Tax=Bacillus massiliglaciei TaxID=1816693 RepID=UPI000AB50C0A|nr:lactonase family protein [Bacillus massiliglaciei]